MKLKKINFKKSFLKFLVQSDLMDLKISCHQKNKLIVFIIPLALKCVATNSKLLLRKIFFEIFLVQSDLVNFSYNNRV